MLCAIHPGSFGHTERLQKAYEDGVRKVIAAAASSGK